MVGLCDVSVDSVDALDDAPIPLWKPCVCEDWGHVSPVLARVIDQISKRSLSEFYAVDSSLLSHNVAQVACSRPTCRPEIENTISTRDGNFRQPFQYGGSELTPIRVPDSILSISDLDGVFPVDGRPGVLAECG